MKVSNRLQEKYDYHANDKTNDMYGHFDILSDVASNCEHVTELGVRGICSSWAFLKGMASMANRFVTVTPEERTKLYMISAKLLVSIDHIHPNDFGGNLEEFEEIAKENDVNLEFINADILNYKSDKKYDIIVSNPPYVLESEKMHMSKNVLDYEPELALFVKNDDPLQFYKAILGFAKNSLNLLIFTTFLSLEFLLLIKLLSIAIDSLFGSTSINVKFFSVILKYFSKNSPPLIISSLLRGNSVVTS